MPFSIEDTFNRFIDRSGQSGDAESPRNAFVFSSTLRDENSGHAPAQFEADVLSSDSIPSVESGSGRDQPIALAINPSSIRFRQPKRYKKVNTMNGSVIYHFTNSKGENNDLLTLSFRGSSGNIDRNSIIDPFATTDDSTFSDDTGAFQKLLVWHNLWALTRERVILDDGRENEFRISYISPLIPTVIDFVGIFTNVLEFEESAKTPNSNEYSMDFLVKRTNPDLSVLVDEVQTVLSAIQAVPAVTATIFGTTQAGDFGTIADGRVL